jgi:hypothetical protein
LVIFLAVKKTSNLHARTRGDPRLAQIANCAICLHYTLIVYAVSVFFDYIAYTSMLPVFAGLAAALDMTAPEEIERMTAGPAPVEPVPFEQFRPTWRTTAGFAPQV